MGAEPVKPKGEADAGKWGLTRPQWKDIQSFVASGLSQLPWGQALFLQIDRPGGGWLRSLRALEPIKKGLGPINNADGLFEEAVTIAFTWTGLQRMGLSDETLKTFTTPFREGMHQEDRRRRLGDEATRGTIVREGLQWSGNVPPEDPSITPAASPKTVHALLLLYDWDEGAVERWALSVQTHLNTQGVTVVHRLPLSLNLDKLDKEIVAHEHFGFTDGRLQPEPYLQPPAGNADETYRWRGIPLADVLLGYPNFHNNNEIAPCPLVPFSDQSTLRADGAPEGYLNLGLNGSYLVVRELRQDVAAFWSSLESAAATMRKQGPHSSAITADWLAARIIGRQLDGSVLCPPGVTAPQNDNFGYLANDPYGFGCPFGSHVRRANPRDGLARDARSGPNLLDAANHHRIMRRGRNYGEKIADRMVDDGKNRGLLFMCLNTDIARQFEFVQQTWLLNPSFATLFNETDPLVGPKGPMTIPEDPLRRVIEVETYVKLAGGEYFFLPSVSALDYLQGL